MWPFRRQKRILSSFAQRICLSLELHWDEWEPYEGGHFSGLRHPRTGMVLVVTIAQTVCLYSPFWYAFKDPDGDEIRRLMLEATTRRLSNVV